MPVEITLPLTKLEQAVADARANEQVMAAKVEEAKLVLKSAKAAWEESVGEVFRAIDDMIADKRQPSLPFDESDTDDKSSGGGDPNPPAPAPSGAPVDPAPVSAEVTVEIISPLPMLAGSKTVGPEPTWRALNVTQELECPPDVLRALDVFGVFTLGQLADALGTGHTFNLKLADVFELQEAIEDVSSDDDVPLKFSRDDVAVTVKDQPESEADFEARKQADHDLFAPPVEPEPEPAKPAKKGRTKKGKMKDDEKAEGEPTPQPASFDDL